MASGTVENILKVQELLLALYTNTGQGLRYQQFMFTINSDFCKDVLHQSYQNVDTSETLDLYNVEDTTYIAYLEQRLANQLTKGA